MFVLPGSKTEELMRVTRTIAVALLTLMVVNVLGILNTLPPAYASTCTYTGGHSGHYLANAYNTGGNVYGNAGRINAEGWNEHAGFDGVSATWIGLGFQDLTLNHIMDVGLIAGQNYYHQNSSSRVVYFELSTAGGYWFSWQTSYPIPANDNNYGSVYTYKQESDGTYDVSQNMNSTYYGYGWGADLNTYSSADYKGNATVSSENTYIKYYNSTCNYIEDNAQSALTVTTAISSTPSWSSWGSSHGTPPPDSPYSLNVDSSTSFDEYGG